MKCPHCGTETSATYCTNCGQLVVANGAKDIVTEQVLAGWGMRVGASIIDYLIMFVPVVILKDLLGSITGSVVFLVIFCAYLVTQWLIYDGRSVGNRVMHTQVRDAISGGPVSNAQALWRYFYLIVYVIFDIVGVGTGANTLIFLAFVYFFVDLLYPLWDKRKQTMHDKLAHTIVIVTR
jgi:uncharacterized RDD family membrane protein YckC